MNNEAMLRSHDRVSEDEGRQRVIGGTVHPTLDPNSASARRSFLIIDKKTKERKNWREIFPEK